MAEMFQLYTGMILNCPTHLKNLEWYENIAGYQSTGRALRDFPNKLPDTGSVNPYDTSHSSQQLDQ
ncbi:MAG: hypothetical protein GYA34_15085 [Chloroflexi bacterium]|nr:hypothetical protein [Chloroflexota bacterium]